MLSVGSLLDSTLYGEPTLPRAPTRGFLDCPVPRLTLLFFGAAKDVPEAAKMVTAGTAGLKRACKRPKAALPLVTTPDQV